MNKVEDSKRLQKVRETTYSYLVREVDPIIAKCITHLLLIRPEDNLPSAMLAYLQGATDISEECLLAGNGLITKRDQRMYLATKITPVLTKLMAGLAKYQPSNVVEYLCKELSLMIEKNECIELDSVENLPRPNKDQKRPQTSKGKLGDALAYDRSRMAPTELERPGTAPQPDRTAIPAHSPSSSSRKSQQISNNEVENSTIIPIDKPPMMISSTPIPNKIIQVAMLGTGGAGKTSIISALQGDNRSIAKPTLGFRPTTMMLGSDTQIKFYDLGGGKKIRDIWTEYYHDVHAYIFVVDTTIPLDSAEWLETKEVFTNVASNLLLAGKPFLVIANKADRNKSVDLNEICSELKFKTDRMHNIIACSARGYTSSPTSTTNPEEAVSLTDSRLEMGIEWLLTVVNSNFDVLDTRVASDTKIKAAAEAKKRIARERKVLRNKIAAAFFDSVRADLRPDGLEPAGPEEIYAPDEGISFLMDEIGATPDTIGEDAKMVAQLIGYQRLALQIVGALFAPVSKKKVPMTWVEIKDLVHELRVELGLD
jgi:ADP-ribosylation factor-like protein 13B